MVNNQATASTFNIPTFIPLNEAAQKYNLSEKALTQLIRTGKIEAVQLSTGELLVAAEKNGQKLQTKEQIIQERYVSLVLPDPIVERIHQFANELTKNAKSPLLSSKKL